MSIGLDLQSSNRGGGRGEHDGTTLEIKPINGQDVMMVSLGVVGCPISNTIQCWQKRGSDQLKVVFLFKQMRDNRLVFVQYKNET